MPNSGSHWSSIDKSGSRVTRREALAALASTGALSLAGCSGGDGGNGGDGGDGGNTGGDGSDSDGTGDGNDGEETDDGGGGAETATEGGDLKTEFTYTTGPSSSLAFAMANQMASQLSQNSELNMQVKAATSGQSVSQLLQGGTEIAYSTAFTGQRAVEREGPFGQIDASNSLLQVASYYFIRVGLVALTDSDIQRYGELAGEPFNPGNAGASFYDPFQAALLMTMSESDIETRQTDVSRLSQNLASGNVVAAGGPLYINGIVPSYITQTYSQNDVRLLAWEEEMVDQIEDSARISGAYMENEALGDIDEYVADDETFLISANYVLYGSELVPEQTVYEMLNVVWDNRSALAEAQAGFRPWTDEEFWTQNFTPEIPVHPGSARFLQEKDLWNDEYEVGEI